MVQVSQLLLVVIRRTGRTTDMKTTRDETENETKGNETERVINNYCRGGKDNSSWFYNLKPRQHNSSKEITEAGEGNASSAS